MALSPDAVALKEQALAAATHVLAERAIDFPNPVGARLMLAVAWLDGYEAGMGTMTSTALEAVRGWLSP